MKNIEKLEEMDLKYLDLLSYQYPDINSACTEIINLQAILNLPKGTEHFVSDIHGSFDSLNHVMRNGSGAIRRKINEVFGMELPDSEKRSLATLIYYPEKKLDYIKRNQIYQDMDEWYKIVLFRLVKVCREVSRKYTRSKVRKSLPKEFSYIIEELLQESEENSDKREYYINIIETIISLGQAEAFIIAISNVIHRLAIDRLHVIGDIYDRGDGACDIMDMLMNYHSIDIQWGNHDISWMAAAAGCEALICTVIRISARYANLDTIEEDYGINLIPLVSFAMKYYSDDPCESFRPITNKKLSESEKDLISKMHKAISILQFKLEAKIIKRHPEYNLDGMLLLDKIDYNSGVIEVRGNTYALKDSNFPTINPENPFELTADEEELILKLKSSFLNSDKLQRHVRFLLKRGGLYRTYNSNLLFHGCIPMNTDGEFEEIELDGQKLSGKALLDFIDRKVRESYFAKESSQENQDADLMWYLWCGPSSPLFGKRQITTFERYFIEDKEAHMEEKNPYYIYRDKEESCKKILKEFGLDPESSHIINGHVPVKSKKGENPLKANGKLYVIDGGFSKAYQKVTGIAGYTLTYNSYSLMLVAHEPFESLEYAVEFEQDIFSETVSSEYVERKLVKDTDNGLRLINKIQDLSLLVKAYRSGDLTEKA